MKLGIKIEYTTGDSFHTEEGLEDIIDLNWEKQEVVEENLKRIKEHYKWYRSEAHSHIFDKVERPKWLFRDKGRCESSINFLLDDGTERMLSCCWIGYFESLQSCESSPIRGWIEAD